MLSLSLTNSWVPSSPLINNHFTQKHPWCSPATASFPFPHSTTINTTITCNLPLTYSRPVQKTNAKAHNTLQVSSGSQEEEEEEKYEVLIAMRSQYNDIVIVDTPKARMLLLDPTHNVHSVVNKGQKWTGSYWDEFASLPAIIPEGPIAIFGLGGGTAAHLMLDLWPSLQLEGWEIDEILIDKAREYFGLSDLEKPTQAGGVLQIHIDDALCPSRNVSRRYAGIVIDLFSKGKVLSQLQEVATWMELNDRLMPNGRFIVNCGGITGESDTINGRSHSKSIDSTWVENSTILALSKAFPGQLSWKRMPEGEGANYLALTGPLPDLTSWSAMVPDRLTESVKKWSPCSNLS